MKPNTIAQDTHVTTKGKGQIKTNQNSSLDSIRSVSILQIIQDEVKLKKIGANSLGLCPFHNEKSPSFTVSESKGFYKCFGCGASGDGIKFIQELHKLSFIEACDHIAVKHNIDFQSVKMTETQYNENLERHEILLFYKTVADWYQEQLKSNTEALKYVNQRISKENIEIFQIGFAPEGWNTLFKSMIKKKYTEEFLLKTKLFTKKDKNKIFDFFQNRIMFPIHNLMGDVIGFGGRVSDNSEPKYINSPESEIFDKSKNLYGLYHGKTHLKNGDVLNITEGYTDVTSLFEAGYKNTVGLLGTALTENHIKLLKRFTSSVNLCMDNDPAGRKSKMRSAELLLKAGFKVSVTTNLPANSDPDNFFRDRNNTMKNENFLTWLADELLGGNDFDPEKRSDAIREMGRWLNMLKDIEQNAMVDYITTNFKKQKITIKTITAAIAAARESNGVDKGVERSDDVPNKLPSYVDLGHKYTYGFWETQDDPKHNKDWTPNQYIIDQKPITNFVLKAHGQIKDWDDDAKNFRYFEMTNVYGESSLIKLSDDDWSNSRIFKKRVGQQGRYVCKPSFGDKELETLKQYWIVNSFPSKKIKELGWQDEGFWAWSNGISTPEITFKPVDEFGFVEFGGKKFFIEYGSKQLGKKVFEIERRFKYIESGYNINDWFSKYTYLYGDQARLSLCFYLTALFQDFIFNITNSLPILNINGSYGTGKSLKSEFLLSLFGKPQQAALLKDTTRVRLAFHFKTFRNALSAIDEYKNSYARNYLEQLKGLYNRQSRKRMIDKDNAENMPVQSMGIIIGQEVPGIDPALTSRLILLNYKKREISDEDQELFSYFKNATSKGYSDITADLIRFRPIIEKVYKETWAQTHKHFKRELLGIIDFDTRLIESYTTIVATFKCLKDAGMAIDLEYDDVMKTAIEVLKEHNQQLSTVDELFDFWQEFETLVHSVSNINSISAKYDYDIVSYKNNQGEIEYVLRFSLASIYKKIMASKGWDKESAIDKTTIAQYLKNSKAFIAYKENLRIGKRVTSGYEFKYDLVNQEFKINIHKGVDDMLGINEEIDKEYNEFKKKRTSPAERFRFIMDIEEDDEEKDDELPF